MRKKLLLMTVLMLVGINSSACGKKVTEEKIKDIDYTLVNEEDIPEYVKREIDSRLKEPFRFSYSDKENMYIAAGYGEQVSGGYSIVVDDLYQSEDLIVFATTLKGPENERKGDTPTYPYIVVKIENMDLEVVYR